MAFFVSPHTRMPPPLPRGLELVLLASGDYCPTWQWLTRVDKSQLSGVYVCVAVFIICSLLLFVRWYICCFVQISFNFYSSVEVSIIILIAYRKKLRVTEAQPQLEKSQLGVLPGWIPIATTSLGPFVLIGKNRGEGNQPANSQIPLEWLCGTVFTFLPAPGAQRFGKTLWANLF